MRNFQITASQYTGRSARNFQLLSRSATASFLRYLRFLRGQFLSALRAGHQTLAPRPPRPVLPRPLHRRRVGLHFLELGDFPR